MTSVEIPDDLASAIAEVADLQDESPAAVVEAVLVDALRDVRARLAPTVQAIDEAVNSWGTRRIVDAIGQLPPVHDLDPEDEPCQMSPPAHNSETRPSLSPTPSPTAHREPPTSVPDASVSDLNHETPTSPAGSPTSPEPSTTIRETSHPATSHGLRSQPTPPGGQTTGPTTTVPSTTSQPSSATAVSTITPPTAATSSEPSESSSTPDPADDLTDEATEEVDPLPVVLDLIDELVDADVTIAEVAEVLGRSAATVYGWRSRRAGLVDQSDVDALHRHLDDVAAAADRGFDDPADTVEAVERPARDAAGDVTMHGCGAKGCTWPAESTWCPRHEQMMRAIVESLRPSMGGARAIREAMDALRTLDDPAGAYGVQP